MFIGNATTCEAASSPYKNICTPKTNTYICIRKSKDMNSKKIARFYKGDGATILSKGKTWYKIKSGSFTGYVKKQYLLSGAKLEAYAEKNNFPKQVKINVRSLNVRKKANIKSAVVTGVSKGEVYDVIRETKKWVKIKAPGGTGYVKKTYITWSYVLGTAKKYKTSSSTTASTVPYSDIAVCCVDSNKRLNIRKAPNTTSAVIGYMNPGSSAKIVQRDKEWTKIQYNSYIGYINNDYYYSGNEAAAYAQKINLEKIATLTVNMNVRAKASVSSARIGGALKGSSYVVTKESTNWVRITFNGKKGYLKKSYLTLAYNFGHPVFYSDTSNDSDSSTSDGSTNTGTGNISGEAIVAYAVQFIGNPYVYGGTSLTEGCDCSGFTQSVFKHFGISIPRVSRDQAKSGTEIAISNIQAGDLLFYANSSGTINHVGIYMGNGKIVNASNEKVGITTYTYTYRTPVKAVRYH